MSAAPHGRLSTFDGIALIVSNVIGGGIFIVPALVARAVPHPAVALTLWGLGGLVAMAGAVSYARLAAAVPRSGGEYSFRRVGMGPLLAFLSGWTSLVAGFSGAIAAGALALVQYASRFAPSLADNTRLSAVAVVCAFAALHGAGLAPGRFVQRALTVAKLAGLILLVGIGAAGTPPAAPTVVASGTISFGPAFIAILFCYSGWNAAAYVTEEVHGGARAVRVALMTGTAIVTGL